MEQQKLYFLARPGFAVRNIAGENMLVPVSTGDVLLEDSEKLPAFNGMVTCNEMGLYLWKQLQQPVTFSGLVQAVQEEYEIPDLSAAEEDIRRFLQEGIENQIIFLLENE